jgi:GH15 family glucan-1,4-alpha-glucosidase
VGLLSEEWGVQSARHLGNTPQAFSHFALVTSALELHHQHTRQSDKPLPSKAGTAS